jgi:putative methyltransferase
MNFYKNAALALDHLDRHQGSVKGSLSAAGINSTPGESKRLLARKLFLVTGRVR